MRLRSPLILALAVPLLPLIVQAAEITGRVVNSDGAPVFGARVAVHAAAPVTDGPFCPGCSPDVLRVAYTERDGSFTIANVADATRFRLLAIASGYQPTMPRTYRDPNDNIIILESLRSSDSAQTFTLRVVDPNGQAIAGAEVSYERDPNPPRYTDRHGELAARTHGSFASVRVRARGYAPTLVRNLLPGETRTIAVAAGASLSGTLTRNGKPAKHVVLKVLHLDRSAFLGDEHAMTDERGRFFIHALGGGESYRIVVLPENNDVASNVITGASGSNIDLGTIDIR